MQYSWWLSGAGAAGLICAMWAPFYRLDFGFLSPFFQQLGAEAQKFGVLAPFISAGTARLEHMHGAAVSAWTAFDSLKIVWLAVGGVALTLTLLSYTGRARGVGRVISLAGALAAVFVIYRLLHRPLPHEVLHLGWGAGAMLVAALLMVVGGHLYDGSAEQGLIVLGGGGLGVGAAAPGASAAGPVPAAEIRSWPASWSEE
jgi:hypothetical protein